jgi:hypothetical protein
MRKIFRNKDLAPDWRPDAPVLGREGLPFYLDISLSKIGSSQLFSNS